MKSPLSAFHDVCIYDSFDRVLMKVIRSVSFHVADMCVFSMAGCQVILLKPSTILGKVFGAHQVSWSLKTLLCRFWKRVSVEDQYFSLCPSLHTSLLIIVVTMVWLIPLSFYINFIYCWACCSPEYSLITSHLTLNNNQSIN